jgi:hypothetical protein
MVGKLTFVMFSAALTLGCSVQPGLANVPQLGGTSVSESRIHDVIANGQDSCGRRDPGPLRYRVMPCPPASRPPSRPPTPAPAANAKAVTTPWVEHYYAHWGCSQNGNERSSALFGAASVPRFLIANSASWPVSQGCEFERK